MRGARRCLHVAPDSRLELLAEWRRSEGGARSVPQTPARIWRNAPFHLAGQKRFSSSSLIENEEHLASLNRCFPYSLFDEQLEKAQILRNGGVFVHTAPPRSRQLPGAAPLPPPRPRQLPGAAPLPPPRPRQLPGVHLDGPAPCVRSSSRARALRWPRPLRLRQTSMTTKVATIFAIPSPAPTAAIG